MTARERRPRAGRRVSSARRARATAAPDVAPVDSGELESLRAELQRRLDQAPMPRWNADPEEVRRAVAKLVLSLVEFLRRLMERQAIRRMEAATLTPEEVEALGLALMRLEDTVRELAARFDLSPADLNLDLGPLGRLI